MQIRTQASRRSRGRWALALFALSVTMALAVSWARGRSNRASGPAFAAPQDPPAAQDPEFVPTEKITADQTVAFPTDI